MANGHTYGKLFDAKNGSQWKWLLYESVPYQDTDKHFPTHNNTE